MGVVTRLHIGISGTENPGYECYGHERSGICVFVTYCRKSEIDLSQRPLVISYFCSDAIQHGGSVCGRRDAVSHRDLGHR